MTSTPVFRTGSGIGATANATSVALTIPATVEAGDVMILAAALKLFVGTTVIATPSGWTELAAPQNGPAGHTFQGAVYMKVADGASAGSTLTVSAGSAQQFNIAFAAYDLAGATPRAVSWDTGSTTAATTVPHAVPTTGPSTGDLVIVVGAIRSSTNGGQPTFTGGTGVTVRGQSVNISGSAENTGAYVGDNSDTNGNKDVTATVASYRISGQVILQPGTVALDRGTSESVTLADAIGRTAAKPRATSESVTLASATATVVARARGTAESVTLADASARNTARLRGLAESLGLADAAATTRVQARAVAEAMTISDAWGYTLSRAIATSESVTLTDGIGRQTAAVRDQPEELTLAGAAAVAQQYSVDVPEELTLADGFGRAVGRPRQGSEAMSFDNVASADTASARYASEAITLEDAAEAAAVLLVDAAAELGLSDDAAAATEQARAVAESLALGNTFDRLVARDRAAGETLAVADSWVNARFALTGWEETVTLDAAASRAATTTGRALPEAVTLAHTFVQQLAQARGFAESLTLADGDWLAARQIIPVSVALEITFSQSAVARVAVARGFTQSVTLVSAVARQINRPRARAETVTLGNVFTVVRGQSLFGSAGMTLDDLLSRTVARAAAGAGGLTLVAAFFTGDQAPGQIPIAYPHRITMTSRPATVRDTTAAGGTVRRTV